VQAQEGGIWYYNETILRVFSLHALATGALILFFRIPVKCFLGLGANGKMGGYSSGAYE
jgi:hypothetical protein